MQSRTSRDPQPTNAGVRALASGNGIVNATVAVLLEWSPETPERITLSLFGYPFMSNQSYELQAGPCRGAMNMPGVEYTASEEIKVASSTNGQTFTILVPLLAPVVIDNEEDDELVTITVRMPAEGVREFLNSTR